MAKYLVEVSHEDAKEVEDMAKALERHKARDCSNYFHSHFARNASLAAEASGAIFSQELKEDMNIYRKANIAKHGKTRLGV